MKVTTPYAKRQIIVQRLSHCNVLNKNPLPTKPETTMHQYGFGNATTWFPQAWISDLDCCGSIGNSAIRRPRQRCHCFHACDHFAAVEDTLKVLSKTRAAHMANAQRSISNLQLAQKSLNKTLHGSLIVPLNCGQSSGVAIHHLTILKHSEDVYKNMFPYMWCVSKYEYIFLYM